MSSLEDATNAFVLLPLAAGVVFAAVNAFKFIGTCASSSFGKGGQWQTVAMQSCAFAKP